MSYMNGRLYSCDRCGETAFCECTGEGELDGGETERGAGGFGSSGR